MTQSRHQVQDVNSAARLLERHLPAGYLEERTRYFAQEESHEDPGAEKKVAIFRIEKEWLALPSSVLTEVVPMRPIHGLPHRHEGTVLGLANIRGALTICVSLKPLLALDKDSAIGAAPDRHVRQRLLVIEGERGRLAFPVDEMQGIHQFKERDLLPVPETLAKVKGRYTAAILPWKDFTVAYLDAGRLIHALERGLA